jgi:hypothetical protein
MTQAQEKAPTSANAAQEVIGMYEKMIGEIKDKPEVKDRGIIILERNVSSQSRLSNSGSAAQRSFIYQAGMNRPGVTPEDQRPQIIGTCMGNSKLYLSTMDKDFNLGDDVVEVDELRPLSVSVDLAPEQADKLNEYVEEHKGARALRIIMHVSMYARMVRLTRQQLSMFLSQYAPDSEAFKKAKGELENLVVSIPDAYIIDIEPARGFSDTSFAGVSKADMLKQARSSWATGLNASRERTKIFAQQQNEMALAQGSDTDQDNLGTDGTPAVQSVEDVANMM